MKPDRGSLRINTIESQRKYFSNNLMNKRLIEGKNGLIVTPNSIHMHLHRIYYIRI